MEVIFWIGFIILFVTALGRYTGIQIEDMLSIGFLFSLVLIVLGAYHMLTSPVKLDSWESGTIKEIKKAAKENFKVPKNSKAAFKNMHVATEPHFFFEDKKREVCGVVQFDKNGAPKTTKFHATEVRPNSWKIRNVSISKETGCE
ncbi:hypothetical protein [Thiohalorhabdus denitrificans]|uniref:hypothetical protein n=1 Tax=Thiohalorhabdus denitrificans TaxID=381306 RepID=UPI00115FA3FE|nr:hypothetical protein [Thiohalorhabdus denitrificans]